MLFKDVPTYKDDWGDEYYDFSNHPRQRVIYNFLRLLHNNRLFINIFLLLLTLGMTVTLYQNFFEQASRNIIGLVEVDGKPVKVTLKDLEKKDLIECKDGTDLTPPDVFIFHPLPEGNIEIEGRDCT